MRAIDSGPKRGERRQRPVERRAALGRRALMLSRQPEVAWLMLWLVCVIAMVVFPQWQVVPFDIMWISLALLYGFLLWPSRRTLALMATAVATTAAALGDDMIRHLRVMGASVEQIPLLTTLFVVMAWVAHRRVVASDRAKVAAEAQRLLHVQRQFLQDASHQLRTPITIALGHAELLAADLAGRQQQRDIHVVVGELERLRTLSDRLLLIAASENPDFLTLEPTDLDVMAVDLLRRWQPTAPRRWQLGRLDPVRTAADADRLAIALDALVENAVRHTGPDDQIRLEIRRDDESFAQIVVEDTGEGIAEDDVPHIFERFRTVTSSAGSGGRPPETPRSETPRGTGLGLALVEAIARGHGGEVSVQTKLGQGSRFTLRLPLTADQQSAGQVEPELPAVQGLPEVRGRSEVAPGVQQEAL
ncbi:MAG TPA: HAMP domain-containing sensor histidine kinase [Streptosporangiaceae bacterium]|nr:HAMP domain-containing sensor histidine kinase [Streptosporangiaceae bacterium]